MPDYNLGRAHGEIDITYDGSGARRAQADMAATAAEAELLDKSMGRVNQRFDESRKVQISSAEEIIRARGEVDLLRRAYQQQQDEYERGQRRVAEATERARDAVRDQAHDLDALREARIALDRAEDDAERLRVRAVDSYERYQSKLIAVRQEVERFNAEHVRAAGGFRNMTQEAEKFGNALESLEEKLSGVARILGQAGLFGLFGGAAGGSLFASGAGGLQLLATGMGAVVEIAQAFVGALALMPAAINGAVLGLGTLVVAFHGVGQAISSMGDPKAFMEAIKDLSPMAQQAMLQIQQFTSAFRGARDVIQDSLFAPIIADIAPLVQTWLPQLMNAGKEIANQFGQAFHQVFAFFMQPEVQASFQVFTKNLVSGFQAARGAIEPILAAWNKLAEVGSSVFPRIGTAIADIAEKFRAFIDRTAASGQLVEFINKALDAFTNMGRIVRDVALGINNIFGIFESRSGNALDNIAGLAAKFREWTDSFSGQDKILGFFDLIKRAADAVRPTLGILGESFAIIGRTLTELGIAIQPGLASFFTSFRDALAGLAPYVIQLAPAINQFLKAFGDTLKQVVDSIGPKLPALFKDISDAFTDLMKVVPPVADAFANFLDHVTPKEVEIFLGLVTALKGLALVIPVVRGAMVALNIVMSLNPFGLVVIAIAALAAAAYILITNWDEVKKTFADIWDSIRSTAASIWNEAYTWGKNLIVNLGNGIMDAAKSSLTAVIDWVSSLFPDSWKQNSPAKRGPLSQMSTEEMGTRMVTHLAAGMVAGQPAVQQATDGVASTISAGTTGTSFTSGGISGKSGGDFSQGHSGFDQQISFITQDLSAWNNIFQQAFSLAQSLTKIVTDTLRVAANLWGGGDNPLTRPGGLFGPPLPIAQQEVPGVPQKPIPGVAPDQYGRDLAQANAPAQTPVPGVPSKPLPPGSPSIPATPATPPATTTGEVQPGLGGLPGAQAERRGADGQPVTTGGVIPGDNPLRAALRARGVPEDQIRTIEGFSQVEGLNPAGNPTLGWTDSQLGGATDLNAHVDALLKQFKDRESVSGPYPSAGSDLEKAQWIARVVGQNGSPSDWQGNAQPQDYVQRVQAAMQGVPVPTGAGPAPGAVTTGNVIASGAPGPPTNVGASDNGGIAVAGAGALTALGGAALVRAVRKVTAKRRMANGEILDAEDAALAMEPDDAEVRGAGAQERVPPEGRPFTAPSPADSATKPITIGGTDSAALAQRYGVSEAVTRSWSAADVAWLDTIAARPQGLGGAFGNLTESEMTRIGAMVTGKPPGPIPIAPAKIQTPDGNFIDNPELNRTTVPIRQPAAAAPEPVVGRGVTAGLGRTLSLIGPGISPDVATVTGVDANGNPITDRDQLDPIERTLGFNPASIFGAPSTGQADLDTTPFNAGPRAPGAPQPPAPAPPGQQPFVSQPYGLSRGTNTGGYGNPQANKIFPQWVLDLGAKFGVKPSTYGSHQETDRGGEPGYAPNPNRENRGIDWVGTPQQMEAFAQALLQYGVAEGPGGGLEQIIYRSQSGQEYGLGGSGNDVSGGYYPQEGEGSYAEHATNAQGVGGHVHTRFSRSIDIGAPTAAPPAQPGLIQGGGAPGAQVERRGRISQPTTTSDFSATDSSWMQVPADWDITKPIPNEVRRAHGIPDSLPPMYYNAQPGSVQNVPVPPDWQAQHPDSVVNQQTTSLPTTTGAAVPGFPSTNDQRTPMDKFSSAMSSVSSIAGDAFTIFQDVIASIGAAANITDTLVRGFENTESVVGFIQQFQTFIKTGADVAKLVGDVGGLVAAGGSGDPTGGASAIGGAIQAISGIVQSALEATNAAISLGIDIYHEVGKYAGFIMGEFLGGENTGPLGGNVRMLLNTKTNELYTYGEDNALNKNTFKVPGWQRSYTQQPNTQPQLPPQVNIYTGPGQTPSGMMQESMWLIGTGGASVASVAGVD